MTKRTYTASEIIRMRAMLGGGHPDKNLRIVEEQLRTHLLYGSAPDDLEAAIREVPSREQEERNKYLAAYNRIKFGGTGPYPSPRADPYGSIV